MPLAIIKVIESYNSSRDYIMTANIRQSTIHPPSLKRDSATFVQLGKSNYYSQSIMTEPRLSTNRNSMNPKPMTVMSTTSKLLTSSVSQLPHISKQSSFWEQKNYEGVEYIHGRVDAIFKQDYKSSIKIKQRRSYNQKCEEKLSIGQIWVSQSKTIPFIVQQAYQTQQQKIDANSNKKVNFMQGFLPSIGFIFYSIQKIVYFFDVDTMNQDSQVAAMLQLEDRSIFALFDIQHMSLGKPYLSHKRDVLIFLHPYEAELYHFEVRLPFNNTFTRKIDIKCLSIRLPLPSQNHCPLVQTSNGLIYCTNQVGQLCCIEPQNNFLSGRKSLTIRRLPQSIKSIYQFSTKFISTYLKQFYKSITNFSHSIFPIKFTVNKVVYDNNRKLLIVLIKKQMKTQVQQLLVYQQNKPQLLYVVQDDEFMDKQKDSIYLIKCIDDKLNGDYNIALYLDSGKRIFLDLGLQSLKKSIVYQTPADNHKRYSEKLNVEVGAAILQQNYTAHLLYNSGSWSCYLASEEDTRSKKMNCITLQTLGKPEQNQYYLYHCDQTEIGTTKKTLLVGSTQSKAMSQKIRQVFYLPQDILYATQQTIQQIKLLRPIDILFTICYYFHQNIHQLTNSLKIALPQLKIQDKISFISQILIDKQGIYYLSFPMIRQLKIKMGIRLDGIQKIALTDELQKIEYGKLIKEKDRYNRIVQNINDIIAEQGISNKEDKQRIVGFGILRYVSKLMRFVWGNNINSLSCQTCKVAIAVLHDIKVFLVKRQLQLRGENGGIIYLIINWIQHFKQLLLLARTIPTLPQLQISQALLAEPQYFHKNLFIFLTKNFNCQIIDELAKTISFYCTSQFVRVYKLWFEVNPIQDRSKILQICKQHENLPAFFIDYIETVKGIHEFRIFDNNKFSDRKPLQIGQQQTFKQIIEMVNSSVYLLKQKAILLERAEQQLAKQASAIESNVQRTQFTTKGSAQLGLLRFQVKIQQLIKQAYNNQITQKQRWSDRLSSFMQRSNQESLQICDYLERCLFDPETLQTLINQLQDSRLQLMHAYYFSPELFISYLQAMIDKAIDAGEGNISKISKLMKEQIVFIVTDVKLKLQVGILLRIYIQKMINYPPVSGIVLSERGMMNSQLYWPCWFCAQIGQSVEQIYEWTVQSLKDLDKQKDQDIYLYLALCGYYFIKDHLPKKIDQYRDAHYQHQTNNILFQQFNALLLSNK